jgi:hypothetical protein
LQKYPNKQHFLQKPFALGIYWCNNHYIESITRRNKMAYRQMHLNKSGSGMAAKTACGRNILRTPLSVNWEDFKNELPEHQCAKCAASKQAELNKRNDAKNETWVPVGEQEAEEIMQAELAMVRAAKSK